MKKTVTHSVEETRQLAHEWLASLPEDKKEAVVVGLYGNLGAGKTTFVQSVAKELGISETVNSPTFVIEKIYNTNHPHFKRLIHIDSYRLEKGSELQTLGFEELVSNKHNLVLIEWPENVRDILPENHFKIHLTFVDETSRQFEVQ